MFCWFWFLLPKDPLWLPSYRCLFYLCFYLLLDLFIPISFYEFWWVLATSIKCFYSNNFSKIMFLFLSLILCPVPCPLYFPYLFGVLMLLNSPKVPLLRPWLTPFDVYPSFWIFVLRPIDWFYLRADLELGEIPSD